MFLIPTHCPWPYLICDMTKQVGFAVDHEPNIEADVMLSYHYFINIRDITHI